MIYTQIEGQGGGAEKRSGCLCGGVPTSKHQNQGNPSTTVTMNENELSAYARIVGYFGNTG
jgi:hypothetical protein